MTETVLFIFNAVLLGAGLAMDAFSVSIADGLSEPDMRGSKKNLIAGTFAFFQTAMPLAGWLCVHTIVTLFTAFEKFIPWIAFILLFLIGFNMIREGMRAQEEESLHAAGFSQLVMQGIATSIDALSVGFTIADYPLRGALAAALIIGAVTFVICRIGLVIGLKIGTRYNRRASLFGGTILICIGLEILIKGLFF